MNNRAQSERIGASFERVVTDPEVLPPGTEHFLSGLHPASHGWDTVSEATP